MTERVQLIVNSIAGKGRGCRVAPVFEGHLRRLGYVPSTFVTQRRGDASAFAATLDWRTSLIIVVGGDGTLNEVINGQTKIPMAMFPIGTGNAFAADQDPRDARLPGSAAPDGGSGVVRSGRFLGQPPRSGWINVVLAYCLHDPTAPRVGSSLGVVRRDPRHPNGLARRREQHPDVLARVGLTPLASPWDGLLDVCTLPAPSGRDYIRWFFRAFRGRPLTQDGAGSRTARVVRLTGERVACHVDGEYIGLAPMTVSLLPSSVPMLVPASPRGVRHTELIQYETGQLPLAA